MKDIKQTTLKFAKSHNINNRHITFKNLSSAVTRKGYLINYYSKSAHLLIAFGLFDESKESDSVSAVDELGTAYIFIDDSIPKEYHLFTLAHEIGHLVLKHQKTKSFNRQQEREADLFAHYLLSQNGVGFKNTIIGIICMLLSICFLAMSVTSTLNTNETAKATSAEFYSSQEIHTEISKDTICYFTKYGQVYHLYSDCQYVRNAKYVYTDTIEHSHMERLCSACEHRLNN